MSVATTKNKAINALQCGQNQKSFTSALRYVVLLQAAFESSIDFTVPSVEDDEAGRKY